jgi:formate dehydrogenase subunit gamma
VGQLIAWDPDHARALLAEYQAQPGAMLPMLHALQETFSYIDREAIAIIADILNVSRAEVHGVVTFYHDFRTSAPPRHVMRVCRAEACQASGGNALADHACERLGLEFGEQTPDGRVGLEAVYCLGLCSVAPSAMFDGRLVARLNTAKLDALVAEAEI